MRKKRSVLELLILSYDLYKQDHDENGVPYYQYNQREVTMSDIMLCPKCKGKGCKYCGTGEVKV